MMDMTGVHHATENIWHMCLSETEGKTILLHVLGKNVDGEMLFS